MSVRSLFTGSALVCAVISSIATSGSDDAPGTGVGCYDYLACEAVLDSEQYTVSGIEDVDVYVGVDSDQAAAVQSNQLSVYLELGPTSGTVEVEFFDTDGVSVHTVTSSGGSTVEYAFTNPFWCEFQDPTLPRCLTGTSYTVTSASTVSVAATYEFIVEADPGFTGGVYTWSQH